LAIASLASDSTRRTKQPDDPEGPPRGRLLRIVAIRAHRECPSEDPYHVRRRRRSTDGLVVSATIGAPMSTRLAHRFAKPHAPWLVAALPGDLECDVGTLRQAVISRRWSYALGNRVARHRGVREQEPRAQLLESGI
jgi:hypothetical protein